jgi:hypothetical protein
MPLANSCLHTVFLEETCNLKKTVGCIVQIFVRELASANFDVGQRLHDNSGMSLIVGILK